MLFTTFMVKHKLCTYYEIVIFFSDNNGKLVANITKWWDWPQKRSRPNAYVIDVYNQGTSGEDRLGAMQKTALIGATLLIEFAYYLPKSEPEQTGEITEAPVAGGNIRVVNPEGNGGNGFGGGDGGGGCDGGGGD